MVICGDVVQRRRCEITGVTRVKRGPFPWLIHDVDSRTELVLVGERVHEVESPTEINRQLLERLPFILQIQSVKVSVFVVIIDDAQRNRAGLIAIGIDWKNQCDCVQRCVPFR